MSSEGLQKLFCGIYSAFKCSFDEFVGEKVFSPSYSSAILAPPEITVLFKETSKLFSEVPAPFFSFSSVVLFSFSLEVPIFPHS